MASAPGQGGVREALAPHPEDLRRSDGGSLLPETMPPREGRRVDYVLTVAAQHRILEVDEKQHFNYYRAATLGHYADGTPVASPLTPGSPLAMLRRSWRAVASGGRSHRCSRSTTVVISSVRSVTLSPTSCPSSTDGHLRSGSPTSRSKTGFSTHRRVGPWRLFSPSDSSPRLGGCSDPSPRSTQHWYGDPL